MQGKYSKHWHWETTCWKRFPKQDNKSQTKQMDCIKLGCFCTSAEMTKDWRAIWQNVEKIFASYLLDERLPSHTFYQLKSLNNNKAIQLKKKQINELRKEFSEEEIQVGNKYMTDAQHPYSKKRKSKPQCAIISSLSVRLKSSTERVTNALRM